MITHKMKEIMLLTYLMDIFLFVLIVQYYVEFVGLRYFSFIHHHVDFDYEEIIKSVCPTLV